jgi:hypothetical protein
LRKVKIKKTKRTDTVTNEIIEETTHDIEIHNSQSALELMGKHHKLFVERTENVNLNVDCSLDELSSILKEALEAAIATGFELPPINVEAKTLPPVVQPEPPDQPYESPAFDRRLEISED